MRKNRRLHNFLIKQEMQGKYIFTIFVMVLVCCILFSVIFALVSSESTTLTYSNNNLQIGNTPVILFKEILKSQWVFIVAGGFIVTLVSLVMSHRFAGPVFRFENSLKTMIDRDHSFRIVLRPKDNAHELADLLNNYNLQISGDIDSLKKSVRILINNVNPAFARDEMQAEVNTLSTLREIEAILDRYKTN